MKKNFRLNLSEEHNPDIFEALSEIKNELLKNRMSKLGLKNTAGGGYCKINYCEMAYGQHYTSQFTSYYQGTKPG